MPRDVREIVQDLLRYRAIALGSSEFPNRLSRHDAISSSDVAKPLQGSQDLNSILNMRLSEYSVRDILSMVPDNEVNQSATALNTLKQRYVQPGTKMTDDFLKARTKNGQALPACSTLNVSTFANLERNHTVRDLLEAVAEATKFETYRQVLSPERFGAYLVKILGDVPREKKCVITGGAPAAGKGFFHSKYESTYCFIDPDRIFEEYIVKDLAPIQYEILHNTGQSVENKEAAENKLRTDVLKGDMGRAHLNFLNHLSFHVATQLECNIVFDGSARASVNICRRVMTRLTERGYSKPTLSLVFCEYAQILHNAEARRLKTGRAIAIGFIDFCITGLKQAIPEYFESGDLFEKIMLHMNRTDGHDTIQLIKSNAKTSMVLPVQNRILTCLATMPVTGLMPKILASFAVQENPSTPSTGLSSDLSFKIEFSTPKEDDAILGGLRDLYALVDQTPKPNIVHIEMPYYRYCQSERASRWWYPSESKGKGFCWFAPVSFIGNGVRVIDLQGQVYDSTGKKSNHYKERAEVKCKFPSDVNGPVLLQKKEDYVEWDEMTIKTKDNVDHRGAFFLAIPLKIRTQDLNAATLDTTKQEATATLTKQFQNAMFGQFEGCEDWRAGDICLAGGALQVTSTTIPDDIELPASDHLPVSYTLASNNSSVYKVNNRTISALVYNVCFEIFEPKKAIDMDNGKTPTGRILVPIAGECSANVLTNIQKLCLTHDIVALQEVPTVDPRPTYAKSSTEAVARFDDLAGLESMFVVKHEHCGLRTFFKKDKFTKPALIAFGSSNLKDIGKTDVGDRGSFSRPYNVIGLERGNGKPLLVYHLHLDMRPPKDLDESTLQLDATNKLNEILATINANHPRVQEYATLEDLDVIVLGDFNNPYATNANVFTKSVTGLPTDQLQKTNSIDKCYKEKTGYECKHRRYVHKFFGNQEDLAVKFDAYFETTAKVEAEKALEQYNVNLGDHELTLRCDGDGFVPNKGNLDGIRYKEEDPLCLIVQLSGHKKPSNKWEGVETEADNQIIVDVPTAHTFLSLLCRRPLLPVPKEKGKFLASVSFQNQNQVQGLTIAHRNDANVQGNNVHRIDYTYFASGDPDLHINVKEITGKHVTFRWYNYGDTLAQLYLLYFLHGYMVPTYDKEMQDQKWKQSLVTEQYDVQSPASLAIVGLPEEYETFFKLEREQARMTMRIVDIHDDLYAKTGEVARPVIERTLDASNLFDPLVQGGYDVQTGQGKYFSSALYAFLQKSDLSRQTTTIVFPDEGALNRFRPMVESCRFQNIFYCKATRVGQEKRVGPPKYVSGNSEVLGTVLMIDDFVLAGGTLAQCLKESELSQSGKTIHVWVTHLQCLYAQNTMESLIKNLTAEKVKTLHCSNSLVWALRARAYAKQDPKRTQVLVYDTFTGVPIA